MEKNFEELLKELEETVKNLEKSDLSLDDAVKYYQKGLHLTESLQKMLKDAEEVIQKKV